MFLVNRATKRPQRPSAFLGLSARISADACLDFDLAVEQFDLWLEERQNERVEKDAPHDQKPKVSEPKYKTIRDLLGLDDPAFRLSPEDERIAEAVAAGLIDLDDLTDADAGGVGRLLEELGL